VPRCFIIAFEDRGRLFSGRCVFVDIPESGRACTNEPYQRMPYLRKKLFAASEQTNHDQDHPVKTRTICRCGRYCFRNNKRRPVMICDCCCCCCCCGVGPREVRRPLGVLLRLVLLPPWNGTRKKLCVARSRTAAETPGVGHRSSRACHGWPSWTRRADA
jgi:hypothetical protein